MICVQGVASSSARALEQLSCEQTVIVLYEMARYSREARYDLRRGLPSMDPGQPEQDEALASEVNTPLYTPYGCKGWLG